LLNIVRSIEEGRYDAAIAALQREAAVHWYIAITRPGHDRLARSELARAGFDVHMPIEHERERQKNGTYRVIADKLILRPYIFVRFNSHTEEEHSVVNAQRGVKCVLLANGKPSPVPARLVYAHRVREYREQYEALKRREKEENKLPLNQPYEVVRGIAEGIVGNLVGIDRGIAFLEAGGKLWQAPVLDIEPFTGKVDE
jgi:transcription antitermination factor NusG